MSGFECFMEDMGARPSAKHSIDRWPDNETGMYEPDNCRWATAVAQGGNKRNNVRVVFNGEEMWFAEACRRAGVGEGTAYMRRRKGLPESEWFKPAHPTFRKKTKKARLPY